MDDLVLDFLSETNEGLHELEKITLALESDPTHTDYIRDAFRILHTIKGTCGFLGFDRMQKVSHAAENVLSQMREGDLEADLMVVSTLFVALDCIRTIVSGIEEKGSEPSGDDSEIIETLNKCLKKSGDSPESNKKKEVASKPKAAKKTSPKEKLASEFVEVKAEEVKTDETSQLQNKAPQINLHEPTTPESKHPAETGKDEEKSSGDHAALASHQTIRIGLDVVDNLMNLVGELVLTRNQLLQQQEHGASGTSNHNHNNVLARLSHLTTELQQTVMKTRMQPIEGAWAKLPRIIRDTSASLGKQIQLKQVGQDTELDRQVIEFIKDPLMHMVRNSADHGIESPEVRKAAGKKEMGTVILKAYHQGGYIFIEISDDGKGIDPEFIKRKALEKNVIDEDLAKALTRDQILQLIFKPGFSTAETITNVSGRGVGMDVVKTNIEKLGGTIELKSQIGQGSSFVLKIPLTLSIISALLVKTGGQVFALPQMAITEILNLKHQSTSKVESIQDKQVLRWRDRLVPIVNLGSILGLQNTKLQKDAHIIILQVMNYTFALSVDEICDSQEIVVKPLSKNIEDIDIFSGSTILGNGQVVLILDQNNFAVTAEQSGATQDSTETSTSDIAVKDTIILIFKTKDLTRAVPLALVSRIDEVAPKDVSIVQGKPILLHRGHLIPIIGFDADKEYEEDEMLPVLIFTDRGYKLAIKIDQIVDIIEDSTEIQLDEENETEILGTTIIRDNPVSIIDCQYYFKKAYPAFKVHPSSSYSEKITRNLLLVDDSKFFLNLITPLLSVSGFSVKTASSADEALHICRDTSHKFDVIISDIEMPDKTGYDFLQEVRKLETFETIPVIALSGRDSKEEIEKTKAAGFHDFVPKSDQQTLIRLLNQIAVGG